MFGLSYQQLKDVTEILEALNSVDNLDDDSRVVKGMEWGEGHRAVLGITRIPIWTDYLDIQPRELLGYVEQGDFGWNFTQSEPVSESADD